jgi:hypothetical protein
MEYYTIQQGKIAIPGRGNICEWQKLRCKVSINNWKKLSKKHENKVYSNPKPVRGL